MDEILAKRIYNYIDENPKPILDEIIAYINNILPMLNADETRDIQVEICVGEMIDQHIIYAHLGQYYTRSQYFDAVQHGVIQSREVYLGVSLVSKNRLPDWYSLGACRGSDVNKFFETLDRQAIQECVKVCSECPVQDECLGFGMVNGESGVWGGVVLCNGYSRKNVD